MKFFPGLLLSCLLQGINATPLKAYDAALERRAPTVSATNLADFKLMIQYAAATSCVINNNSSGTPLTCSGGGCPAVEAAGAYSTLEFDYDQLTDNTGYVGVDPKNKLIILAFRGSSSVRNWITNILFLFSDTDICTGCSVHSGFLTAWNIAKPQIVPAVQSAKAKFPDYQVVVTGHSLGGAIATLAAAHLRTLKIPVDLYTYGSPRVGNSNYAEFVTGQYTGTTNANYRVTHLDDVVPRLPPLLLGYRHVSPEYWLSTGTATTIDYTIADIKVCEGTATVGCNAGTLTLDTAPHGYYFQKVNTCGPDFGFKARDLSAAERDLIAAEAIVDKEVMEQMVRRDDGLLGEHTEQLTMFIKLDAAYFGQIESAGLSA